MKNKDENSKKDIQEEKLSPDISLLRSAVFWDTDINKIDWQKQKRAVIQRVFERGNDFERDVITHFYGSETINRILNEL
ncbi:hypothetical protein AR687_23415 [Flavobacteriaceae bacterium CRH]|nr:hypothetical protein AR687_23415 [Flavobacteriaceae bacterium CRH]